MTAGGILASMGVINPEAYEPDEPSVTDQIVAELGVAVAIVVGLGSLSVWIVRRAFRRCPHPL